MTSQTVNVTKQQLEDAFRTAGRNGLIATAPAHLADVVWGTVTTEWAVSPLTDEQKALEHDISVLDYAIEIVKARLGTSGTVATRTTINEARERIRRDGTPEARQKKADKLLAEAQADIRMGSKGVGRSKLAQLAESIDEGGPVPTAWKDR